MGFLDNLFGNNKRDRSAQVAKERLLTVLVHDRVKLTPDMLEQLKIELSEVIARYVPNVNPSEIDVSLLRGDSSDHLKADVPLRRTPPTGGNESDRASARFDSR
ncbi:MAG: cell division topological specificity factor MinE [Chloroflexaceae bacterium]|nr:cell division topological specificity factor MinE [Chloroflexaceae bacterium]